MLQRIEHNVTSYSSKQVDMKQGAVLRMGISLDIASEWHNKMSAS